MASQKKHLPDASGTLNAGTKEQRAIGTKEDAKSLNFFLDSLTTKIHDIKTEILYSGKPITSQKIMDHVMGRNSPRVKVLEEFQKHNNELEAL